jgi:colanic acid biosynthesis glycosyl transferase WcaI
MTDHAPEDPRVFGPRVFEPRIIAVNRFYWPDHSATSQILTDLLTHLAHEQQSVTVPVTVIASRMRYDDPGQRLAAREIKDGVDIRRVWTSRMGRGGLAGRALDYLTFYLSAFVAILAVARRGDVILVKTDPP